MEEIDKNLLKDKLILFESEIADLFGEGKIKAPIHLAGGGEDELIEIFKNIRPQDWVLSSHRSHYHALLKGIPESWLKKEILEGRSMHINNAEYKFMTSSIVSGCLPIAVGLAMAIKMKGVDEKVWVFIGDMAAKTGIKHESRLYSVMHKLPIMIVVEDNGFSVNTPTHEIWDDRDFKVEDYYRYERTYPHTGAGKWVTF